MELRERTEGGVTVLEVEGRVDSVTAPDFNARLSAILGTPQRKVLIDFRQLEYISSAGFRVLFLASKQAREVGSRLALCALSGKAEELFSIAGFVKLFTIAPTCEEGIVALR
jgi:anti-sigma B factor antagonist